MHLRSGTLTKVSDGQEDGEVCVNGIKAAFDGQENSRVRVNGTKASSKAASMLELGQQVHKISKNASWWDLYGVDWCLILFWCGVLIPGLWLMTLPGYLTFILGMVLIGLHYGMVKTKASHLSTHNALCQSKFWQKFWQLFFIEYMGSFSADAGWDIHIKIHHPYTNIIGLGDSSTWRAPFLPRYTYMLIAPLLISVITPFVALYHLIQERKFMRIPRTVFIVMAGIATYTLLIMHYAKVSALYAISILFASRVVLEIPYLHTNIFQHIGLPMYSPNDKPPRIKLMANGALNLSRNWLLDYNFGHSLISCHTEHHLFPHLSDNMCLKVKPIVRDYLKSHGLPYHEKDYTERFMYFIRNYDELMVNAPLITEYAGLQ